MTEKLLLRRYSDPKLFIANVLEILLKTHGDFDVPYTNLLRKS